MGGFGQDFRYALRGLRNNPGFTVMVLLILALAVGASTAVFSVVDAIVLRALPFDEHDRLVAVGERRAGMPGPGIGSIAPQNFLDWREQQDVFDALAGFAMGSFTLQEPGREPEELRVMRVSSEFFDVLRAPPMLGRGFLPENEIEGRDRVAVISYGFWQSRFGGAPDVVGKSIPLEGASYQIAGVARTDFSYRYPPRGRPRSGCRWSCRPTSGSGPQGASALTCKASPASRPVSRSIARRHG